MKKMKAVLWIAVLSCLLFSCNHGLLKDPRLYNAKKKSAGGDSAITVAPEPELQLTGGVDAFDLLDEWYNQSEEGGFPATEFENMTLVGTYFNDSNVPVYSMVAGNVWQPGDSTKSEFIHAKAPNTTGQGYEIKNVYWYSYRGKNPLYAADGTYNTQLQVTAEGNPKLSRFYFYRFTGDTLSPSLDNFLFAVDTYSKFMFAFAYPTKMESVFGNNVPKAWGPTDGSAFLGTTYQFYMYDPVGYVEKVDGKYNVVMYDWFKNNLAKGIYQPTLGGLNDKSQGAPLTPVAEKKPDGQGTSPFNNHKVNFFEENMKLLAGKTFLRREVTPEGRNGVVLYKYNVNSEGTVITRTAESWNDLSTTTSLDTVTYDITGGENAVSGTISKNGVEGILFLEDESRRLNLKIGDETEVCTFIDYGPDFLERVKGSQYKSVDGKTSYEFSEDGTTLIFKADGKTYNYKFEKSFGTNRTEAVFGSNDASAYYAGFRLLSRDGKKDGRIQCTKRSALWAETVDWSMGYAANRVEKLKEDFKSSVAGKTFSLREYNDNDGYTKTLWSWTFDDTGDTATFVTTIWNQGIPQKATAVIVENGDTPTTGKIGANAASLLFDETTGIWTLKVDNKDYTFIYNDPTPSFLNRVKGTTYEGSGRTYVFSEDGKTITCTNGTYENDTYTYVEQDANDRAVYYRNNRPWYEAGLQHWGLRLTNDDNTLYWSGTPWASPSTTPTENVSSKAAWKKPVLGNNFHETVAGRGWQIRKDNADYDGSEDGLELLTWEFSSDGKTATLYEAIWREKRDDEERADDVMTIDITSTGEKSGIGTGGYTFTLSDDLMTLTVTGGAASEIAYKFSYIDPGPAWELRVKGRTYFNSQYMYVFSDDGSSVDFYQDGEKKETWPLSEADSSRTKAVYTGDGLLFKYWGMKLESSDRDLYVTISQGTGKEVLGHAYGSVLNESE